MDELQMTRIELDGNIPKAAAKYEAFGGSVIQFAAMFDSDESEKDDDFLTKIVGVIEAELLGATKGRTFALPNRLNIVNLRTHQAYRRQGIGKALVEAVIQHAHQIGDENTKTVTLKVEREQNPGAARLYEQMGFELHEKVYQGCMIKSLS